MTSYKKIAAFEQGQNSERILQDNAGSTGWVSIWNVQNLQKGMQVFEKEMGWESEDPL